MWTTVAGIFMGWSLGANDAANVFGPMVGSGAVRFRTAAALSSLFIIIGAVTIGTRGFATYEAIGTQTLISSFMVMLAAGITVTLMTFLGLPVSSTQAVVGAIIGSGLVYGGVAFSPLAKIFLSWILTPLGGMVAAYVPYRLLIMFPSALPHRMANRSGFLRIALVLVMCYSAYSLGANNVANVTGVYVGAGLLTPLTAALLGAGSIGLGILTFSGRVIRTVGSRIVSLDPVSAFVVVLAEAITLNVYALIGVPVSASQAVVGAVLGIGLVKGMQTINARVLRRVLFGWIGTPALAAAVAAAFALIAKALT
ncbi:inorganic phosphate transporter family protein [Candidatus Bipolaricaulota bacterium]|nr:inorganic phosphate transporter family protein [Candidatus Bipolaricaulota bacterium]